MRSHLEIVTTDAEQPYLARLVADNGEQVWRTSENYADIRTAERAVCIAAEAFFLGRAELILASSVEVSDPDEKRVRLALEEPRAQAVLSVPIVYVDERRKCRVCGCSEYSPCSPPCHWVAQDLCSNPACVAAAGPDEFVR